MSSFPLPLSSPAAHLLRTAVRTFYPVTRQILILDALLTHRVLHLEDICVILSAQNKEVRSYLNPLKASRLISVHTRKEVRVVAAGTSAGNSAYGDRSVQREYHYINVMEAIDAIKYRIMKLRKAIEAEYKTDETEGKDWVCPRCGAEYDMMQVLTFDQGDGGYECERCGTTLIQDEERVRDKGSGKKVKLLNEQLAMLDDLIAQVDAEIESGQLKIDEIVDLKGKSDGGFERLWNERVKVERRDGQTGERYVSVKEKGGVRAADVVKAENLEVSLRTQGELTEEERKKEEERREKIRLQNQLPEWHAHSAIGLTTGTSSTVNSLPTAATVKNEEETKPDVKAAEIDEQMAAYLALMEKERAEEEERKKQADAEAEEDFEEDDEFDGDFEQVDMDGDGNEGDNLGSSVVGTPMSTQEIPGNMNGELAMRMNGNGKRELVESSSEAATPDIGGAVKKAKVGGNGVAKGEDEESDEDEVDFEDV